MRATYRHHAETQNKEIHRWSKEFINVRSDRLRERLWQAFTWIADGQMERRSSIHVPYAVVNILLYFFFWCLQCSEFTLPLRIQSVGCCGFLCHCGKLFPSSCTCSCACKQWWVTYRVSFIVFSYLSDFIVPKVLPFLPALGNILSEVCGNFIPRVYAAIWQSLQCHNKDSYKFAHIYSFLWSVFIPQEQDIKQMCGWKYIANKLLGSMSPQCVITFLGWCTSGHS